LAFSDQLGLWFVPTGTARWLSWSLPDGGLTLQSTSSLSSPWVNLFPPNIYQGATFNSVPISAAMMASGSAFFRLANSN
jgi:hypothetical protein